LNTLIGFLYRCLPYLICSVSLIIASRRFTKWLKPVSLASILSVLSPLFAVASVSLFTIPVSEFREKFWPLRPLVQVAVFFPSALIARGIMHLTK